MPRILAADLPIGYAGQLNIDFSLAEFQASGGRQPVDT